MDPTNQEWYTTILEECKSLDINNFLYDVNPYVVNRPLSLQHAASSSVSDLNRPIVVPCRRLVKMDIFRLDETTWERSSAPCQDTPLSSKGSREFDQFGSMQGEMRRDPDVFAGEVENPVSSS